MEFRRVLFRSAMGAMLLTAACTTNPETGNQRLSKGAIGGVAGAVGGYLLGDLIGGRGDRTEKIVGAGLGPVAGAGIGASMDSQEKKLREETAGTGVSLIPAGANLMLRLPSGLTFATHPSAIQPKFRPFIDYLPKMQKEK